MISLEVSNYETPEYTDVQIRVIPHWVQAIDRRAHPSSTWTRRCTQISSDGYSLVLGLTPPQVWTNLQSALISRWWSDATPVSRSESPFCDHIFPKPSALSIAILFFWLGVSWFVDLVLFPCYLAILLCELFLHLSVLNFTLDLLYLRALSPRSASCVKFKWKVLRFCWSLLHWSSFYNMCDTWFAPPSDSQPEERLLDYTCYSCFVTLLIFTYGNGADWRYMTPTWWYGSKRGCTKKGFFFVHPLLSNLMQFLRPRVSTNLSFATASCSCV